MTFSQDDGSCENFNDVVPVYGSNGKLYVNIVLLSINNFRNIVLILQSTLRKFTVSTKDFSVISKQADADLSLWCAVANKWKCYLRLISR